MAGSIDLSRDIPSEANFLGLVGQSRSIVEVRNLIERVAKVVVPTLLIGEAGTGKGLVARLIHAHGPTRDQPFVDVLTSAIPPELLEEELFGSSGKKKVGLIQAAEGGTFLLNDIDTLPLTIQAKLLHAIQTMKQPPANVRWIGSVQASLTPAIEAGRFREDLFYRIAMTTISMPALRDRREDIPLLVQYFVRKFAQEYGRTFESVPASDIQRLLTHPWPGNVAQLVRVVESAVIRSEGGELRIDPDDAGHPDNEVTSLRDIPTVRFVLDPGTASADDLATFLSELSKLHRMLGGNGLQFTVTDSREPSQTRELA